MTKTTFARITKLNDVVGRCDYISSNKRQEHLLFSSSNVPSEYWKQLAFESEKVQARELIIAIPNELVNIPEKQLKQFCDGLVNQLQFKETPFDWTYSIHANKKNLHMHLIFSERTLEHPENVPQLEEKTTRARYKVDGKQVTKKVYEAAKAAGIKNIEYQPKKSIVEIKNRRFSDKNKEFERSRWLEKVKTTIAAYYNSQELVQAEWNRNIPEGHLAQDHVGKGSPEEYEGVRKRIEYNSYVKQHNRIVDYVKQKYHIIIKDVSRYVDEFFKALSVHYAKQVEPKKEERLSLAEQMKRLEPQIQAEKRAYEERKKEIKHKHSGPSW